MTAIVQLICLCHSSPDLLSLVHERRGRWHAAPQVSNSKAELKQRFIIRPEKVETNTMSLVDMARIRVRDELRMMASPKNQGRYFLVVMLNIEVDHYFFSVLHLGLLSIPLAPFSVWNHINCKAK